jgi:hypothetical protein
MKNFMSDSSCSQLLRNEASLLLSAVSVSAFGGVLSTTLGEAEGAVVLSPLFTSTGNPLVTIPATIDGLYINVETGTTGSSGGSVAGWDINPYSATSLTWFNATGTSMMRYPGVTSGSAGSLDLGTMVGPTGSFGSGAVIVGAALGNWELNSDNYFGFRFVASDGGTKYGWGTMQVGAAITTRSITELYYEDSGNPILVGSGNPLLMGPGNAVPEPGTPLALLALGASGMVHRRRRRAVA